MAPRQVVDTGDASPTPFNIQQAVEDRLFLGFCHSGFGVWGILGGPITPDLGWDSD